MKQRLFPQVEQHDVTIIGAGLAGLTAAAYLSQAGLDVLVCEQSPRIGGLFNSFEHKGYVFDGGIKAVVNSGMLKPMLSQLGLLDQIPMFPSHAAYITGDKLQPLLNFNDVETYFQFVKTLYPHEEKGLDKVLLDTRKVFNLLDALLNYPNPLFLDQPADRSTSVNWMKANLDSLKAAPVLLPIFTMTMQSYLEKHLHDDQLVNFLSQIFPHGTSAFFGLGYFRMFMDYSYPLGGVSAIPNALASLIRANHGEIRLDTRVEKILIESGVVKGVILDDGESIHCRQIINAGDSYRLYTSLLQDFPLPGWLNRKLKNVKPSHSAFNVYLGVNIPVEKLGLKGCHHLFFSPSHEGNDPMKHLNGEDYFAVVPQEITVPCLNQPELAPKGKTGLVLSAMTEWSYAQNWGLQNRATKLRYDQLKNKFADQMIMNLEKFIPGLSKKIEVRLIATPISMHEHTLNWQGAIMGWSYEKGHNLNRHGALGFLRSIETPVKNLYSAGHWTMSPGGSPIAILTAKLAVDRVLKEV